MSIFNHFNICSLTNSTCFYIYIYRHNLRRAAVINSSGCQRSYYQVEQRISISGHVNRRMLSRRMGENPHCSDHLRMLHLRRNVDKLKHVQKSLVSQRSPGFLTWGKDSVEMENRTNLETDKGLSWGGSPDLGQLER